jgi:DNA repair protein RadC
MSSIATPRLRERLQRWGVEALSTEELLDIVLDTPKNQQNSPAQSLVDRFGSVSALLHRSPTELAEVSGMTPARACRLLAALALPQRMARDWSAPLPLENPEDIFNRFKHLARVGGERVVVLALNARNQLIREKEIAHGSLTQAALRPVDAFEVAIRERAVSIILVHSHPSGDPTPSKADLDFTRRLVRAGEIMGIRVVDHIIVGIHRFCSLAREGRLK